MNNLSGRWMAARSQADRRMATATQPRSTGTVVVPLGAKKLFTEWPQRPDTRRINSRQAQSSKRIEPWEFHYSLTEGRGRKAGRVLSSLLLRSERFPGGAHFRNVGSGPSETFVGARSGQSIVYSVLLPFQDMIAADARRYSFAQLEAWIAIKKQGF